MARTFRPVARSWQPDAALLEGLIVAVVALDADGTVRYANPAALDLFGSPYDGLVGQDARTRLFDEPERGAVDQVLGLVRRAGSWTGELTVLSGGTTPRAVPTTWTRLDQSGEEGGALLLVEGAAEPGVRVGTRLRRLADVITEMLGAGDVETVSAIVSDHLMTAAGATAASLSLVEGDALRLVSLRGGLEDDIEDWRTLPLAANVPGAECIRTGQTVFVTRAAMAERYPELPLANGTGSILCLPMAVPGGRVLGAVTLSFPGRRRVAEAEGLFLRLLVDTCAMTSDRISAQAAAADREGKLTFLAQASAELSSELDHEATLAAVADAAVPWFADWCTVSLEQDGVLRTIATAHAKPESVALVRRLQEEYAAQPGDGSYVALETGRSLLVQDVTDELLAARAQDEQHLELLRALHLRSGLVCPLTVGERTFGVITWVTGEGGRRFGEDDQAFGLALAQRAAVAIDNAQLHSQVRTAALELQRAVLPERLPEVSGWSTAVTYLLAGRTDGAATSTTCCRSRTAGWRCSSAT